MLYTTTYAQCDELAIAWRRAKKCIGVSFRRVDPSNSRSSSSSSSSSSSTSSSILSKFVDCMQWTKANDDDDVGEARCNTPEVLFLSRRGAAD